MVSTPHGGLATNTLRNFSDSAGLVSTPHGGLATQEHWKVFSLLNPRFNSTRWISNKLFSHRECFLIPRFNSTRWISNSGGFCGLWDFIQVSTPHGGLATKVSRVNRSYVKEVSTPHGGLATYLGPSFVFTMSKFQLHTVD